MIDVRPYLGQMMTSVEADDYAGYDPYDALNSPLLRRTSSRSKWLRIVFTQFIKRCPVNIRPLLFIEKSHNPKAIGLFLWGYVKLYSVEGDAGYLHKICHLLALLDKLKGEGYSGNCWGYNFDWQSRTYFRPRGVPNIVNTAFIGHALLDCYEKTGEQRALNLAVPIKDFILNDLRRTRLADTFCFSYTPVDTAVVHNANMLGASVLVRLMRYCADASLEDAALSSLAYSMHHQRDDGSWYYADTSQQRWIDSFHTGFNLQALRYFLVAGIGNQYRQQYEKGVRYYAENFFVDDGTPKYYHNKIYPIDIHCPTQAVVFFSGLRSEYQELANRILRWMLENMWTDKGYFYFQKHPLYTNRISYMRWSQAWAFHALTEYVLNRRRGHEGSLSRFGAHRDHMGIPVAVE